MGQILKLISDGLIHFDNNNNNYNNNSYNNNNNNNLNESNGKKLW
jgi:hypothetical protein